MKHGEWLPWLKGNFNGSERHARNYMRVAANRQRVADLSSLRAALKELADVSSRPHVAQNSGENEWYTPDDYLAPARTVLGEIDLDPASTAQANEVVQAEDFYTAEDDGLSQNWHGRVWMNPPYAADLIGKFTDKMAESYESGAVTASITLVNNATETQWFQRLARVASAICFPEKRVRFLSPDGEKGAPLQGQALIYCGDEPELFADEYRALGFVVDVRRA
jgi:phage N-6-adenine-methyltransferase